MSENAFPVCCVCGVEIPEDCVICSECAANAADRCMYNFNKDKAEGRLIDAMYLMGRSKRSGRPMSVKKQYPMMFQATALAGMAGTHRTHRSRARERRFERYAKGSRKIAEFFPAVKNRKSS